MNQKQLQALRTKIAALKAEREDLQGQVRSRGETAEYVRDHCRNAYDEFAARARAALRSAAAGGDLTQVFRSAPMAFGLTDAVVPLAGLVGPEALAESLLRHIEGVPEGIDADGRAGRLAEIDAELEALERQEEEAIEQSELTDSPFERRFDARPEIVLGLS